MISSTPAKLTLTRFRARKFRRKKPKYDAVHIKKEIFRIAITFAAITSAGSTNAAPFQATGYIQNHSSEKCWYTQKTDAKSKYFHGSITGEIGTITFDDPKCMSEGPGGQDVNIMMINNAIANLRYQSHVQPDAAFQTKASDLLPSSTLQKRGRCMQSRTYRTVGVTLDYEMKGRAIVKVRHGSAIDGCTN